VVILVLHSCEKAWKSADHCSKLGHENLQEAGESASQAQFAILEKKPKGQEWSVGDKFLNHLISSARIIVENVIAGVKRCRIVKDVLRLTTVDISDLVMEIACGLHNLRMSCRHPLPTFDIRSLLNSG
jgi:hypothetical protein